MTDDDGPTGGAGGTPVAGSPTIVEPGAAGPSASARPPRNRTAQFAWVAVAVILVAVIALVTYALTDPPVTPQKVQRAAAPPGVVAQLAKVPTSVFDTVGATPSETGLVAPTVLSGQPPLRLGGKPAVLYVGAEYCPFCAAERWPLIVALSRFGSFRGLKNMESAPLSVFPDTQTFSFVGSTYSSRYLAFTGVELYSDAVDARGTFARITTLTPAQSLVVTHYGGRSGETAASGRYPFVDIADRMVLTTSAYSPAILERQSQAAIAADLSQAQSPVTQAVVASANQLAAGMCAATGQRPAAVCTSKGVRDAAVALGMG